MTPRLLGEKAVPLFASIERSMPHYQTLSYLSRLIPDQRRCSEPPLYSRRFVLARSFLAVLLPLLSSCTTSKHGSATQASALDRFNEALEQFTSSADLVEASRAGREFASYLSVEGDERAPSRQPKSDLKISSNGQRLIVECEISNPGVYERRYRRPIWPKGQSGVTIGVGYDLGFTTTALFQSDWQGYISPEVIDLLSRACGVTGPRADRIASELRQIDIVQVPWEAARRQFFENELPRYIGLTESSLPNFAQLKEHCRGALASLVYNRGASFSIPEARDPAGRYVEMRRIYAHMRAENYRAIPAEIRSMRRLWAGVPDMAGLLTRRALEAELFELGMQ